MYLRAFVPLFLLSFSALFTAQLVLDKPIQSECVVLINGDTGRILWKRNADKPCYPASTTKIATTFFTLMHKSRSLKEKIPAPKEALVTVTPYEKMRENYAKCPSYWLETDGTHASIKVGEMMSIDDLIYATMLASANDAANILAYNMGGGSIPHFMESMNRFLQKIGCKNTHFCNPHGLHHPEHVTTARDMTRLAQCAMYHPLFRKLVKTQKYERQATNKQPKATYTQHNKLLVPGKYSYPHAVGIKTGHTSKAQYALVAAAEKEGRLLIAAIMQANDKGVRYEDAHTLFNAAFREKKIAKTVLIPGHQRFSRTFEDAKDTLTTYTKAPLEVRYYPSEEPELRCELTWSANTLPIKKDQEVGAFRLFADEVEVARTPLFAQNAVDKLWGAKIRDFLQKHWLISSLIVVAAIALLTSRRR